MKKRFLLIAGFFIIGLIQTSQINAQSTGYVKQIITGNSGKFEFTPPYTDYITLQTFNPQTNVSSDFATIYTQSLQSIAISGNLMFVSAQDSIVKYNLNNLHRVGAVADSGLNQMAVINGWLVVSKQYPVTSHYIEVLDTSTMTAQHQITGISGDCAGITQMGDTAYVAVNGGYMGTTGKLAIIDALNWTLVNEIDLGTKAIGINNLYNYNNEIFCVCKTPYGVVDTGNVSTFKPSDGSFANHFVHHSLGAGAGVNDSIIYMGFDNGIGSFNMNTLIAAGSPIIQSPGGFSFITSAVVDSLNGLIYANIGDYATPGRCLVTTLAGDSVTSYSTGISTDAVAVDYRHYPAGIENISADASVLTIYPNPVSDRLNLDIKENTNVIAVSVSDINGRILIRENSYPKSPLSCQNLSTGIYYLYVVTPSGIITKSFLKK